MPLDHQRFPLSEKGLALNVARLRDGFQAACRNVVEGFLGPRYEFSPSKDFNDQLNGKGQEVLNYLGVAARGQVKYSDDDPKAVKIPTALRAFLDSYSGRPMYYESGYAKLPLVQSVQARLMSPSGRPLGIDGNIGRETAQALLRELEGNGSAVPRPCF